MRRIDDIDKIVLAFFIAAIVLCAILLTSCKTKTVIVTEYKERKVEVRVRDTAIVTAADSASVRALLHCDSAYNVVVDELTALQGGRIKADVQVAPLTNETSKTQPTKTLLITCKEDSLRTIIHMQDSIISDLTQQSQTVYVPRERNGYDKFVSGWFWVTAILLLLIVAFWICDKIPATKPYTAIIKGLFKWL